MKACERIVPLNEDQKRFFFAKGIDCKDVPSAEFALLIIAFIQHGGFKGFTTEKARVRFLRTCQQVYTGKVVRHRRTGKLYRCLYVCPYPLREDGLMMAILGDFPLVADGATFRENLNDIEPAVQH